MADVKPVDPKKVEAFKKVKPENRTEEQWNAIYDANTLSRAYAVMKDPTRLEAARVAAVILLEEEKDINNGFESIIKDAKI